MNTDPVSHDFAQHIERAEIQAWLDLYAAMPEGFAKEFNAEILELGQVTLTRCPGIAFGEFNRVMGLGVFEPATEQQLETIFASYHEVGVKRFLIHHIPACQPAALINWLEARQPAVLAGWERIVRDNAALEPSPADPAIEQVTTSNANEWADFIDAAYHMPTKPWLLELVGRPGWYHYLLRENTKLVAVRSMCINPDGTVWFGIEAPVPGIMAPSFALDARLCQTMMHEGLKMGAKLFVADIEKPALKMDTPAYQDFANLGFSRPYFRSNYVFAL
jgi:hypothetical protein